MSTLEGVSSSGQKSLGRINLLVDQVLERVGSIAISAEVFERFVHALEGQVEPMPTLSRYAQQTSPIPVR